MNTRYAPFSAFSLLILLLLAGAWPDAAHAQDAFSWSAAAPSPVERFEGPAVATGGKVYVFGGFADGLLAQVRSDVYDPATDTWTRLADLPVANTHVGVAAAGGKIYFAGGFLGDHPGTATDAVVIYDIASDTFTEGPPLPAARAAGALVHHLGMLHHMGGLQPDRRTEVTDHYVLDLDDVEAGWTTAAPMPEGRNHMNGVSLNGRIYVVGGQTGHDGPSDDKNSLFAYDPSTDAWTQLADLPEDRSHAEPGTFVWNGQIILAGGKSDGAATLSSIRAYDPVTDEWSALGELPASLRAPVAQVIGDTFVMATGGSGGSVLFISDANFGSDWADAPDSDQQFLDRFGWVMNQDNGTYVLDRGAGDFRVPDHPIFDGVDAFGGEGVSPIMLDAPTGGVAATILAGAEGQTRVNAPPFGNNRQGDTRPVTSDDAALLIAEVDAGRLAGHFDRNTFFNPGGAGGDLTQFDNERYALNLFRWLTEQTEEEPPGDVPVAGQTIWLRAVNGKFVAARYALPEAAAVRLTVYDILGRRVMILAEGEQQAAGWHEVPFEAKTLPSGVYVYRFEAGAFSQAGRMVLTK